jgi:hypothetical protein
LAYYPRRKSSFSALKDAPDRKSPGLSPKTKKGPPSPEGQRASFGGTPMKKACTLSGFGRAGNPREFDES